jgi:hypothetical protein
MPGVQKKANEKPPAPQYLLPGIVHVGHVPDAFSVKNPVDAAMIGVLEICETNVE